MAYDHTASEQSGSGAKLEPFDAIGFLRDFEAIGGRVYSDGRSFAIVYPAETDFIPLCLIEWGAVIECAHMRARASI